MFSEKYAKSWEYRHKGRGTRDHEKNLHGVMALRARSRECYAFNISRPLYPVGVLFQTLLFNILPLTPAVPCFLGCVLRLSISLQVQ